MSDDSTNHDFDDTFRLDANDTAPLDTPSTPEPFDRTPTVTVGSKKKGGGAKRRLGGMLAALLGLAGCVLGLALVFLGGRTLIGASDTADGLLDPVATSIDRMDVRIDQADDLVNRVGAEPVELRARVDGLVDVVGGTSLAYSALGNSPIYGLVPETDLAGTLADFQSSADEIDQTMALAAGTGNGDGLDDTSAATVAERINNMQGQMTALQDQLDQTRSSFTRWLRLGGLAVMALGLWSLWAQYCLLRRGMRGLAGRPAQP